MFHLYQDYDRDELLAFVGSKQPYSGIIWGPKDPRCVIVTSGGKGGTSAGYGDSLNRDGTRFYIGQGEKGDQNPDKLSNSLLAGGERSVLFFSTTEPTAKEVREKGNRRKRYKYEGVYEVASWDYIEPKQGKRKGDQLLQFHLIPASNVFGFGSDVPDKKPGLKVAKADMLYLRDLLNNRNDRPGKGTLKPREYNLRSQQTVDYAKLRAQGICEYCNRIGPFLDVDNLPYLEVHHILKLADDGPDKPVNVAALCPNCHKEAHFGLKQNDLRVRLIEIIEEKERKLEEAGWS